MKQTAVEWLTNELKKGWTDEEIFYIFKLFDQAKEMEKQQIYEAFYDAEENAHKYKSSPTLYYNETYGSKGSDDHIVDGNKMIEISDSEINDVADKLGISTIPMTYFIEGAKWYREQLKQRQ